MDIHRPKPWHGWREFFKEYVIIFVGVLTALAAEQGVEALHERHLRAEAREAIRGEIARNLDSFRRRDAVQACIDKRLLQVEHLLVSTAPGAKVARPLWIGRPQVWLVPKSRWIAATSGARTALLDPAEQADYAEIYAGTDSMDAMQGIEQLAWAKLRALETLPTLEVDSRDRLIEALHEARYANFRIKIIASQTRDLAKRLGIERERSPYGEGSLSVCLPMNSVREQALKNTIPGRKSIAEP